MASIVETIATRLRTDASLVGALSSGSYAGLLKGGVWTRPLKREAPGDTPEAFRDVPGLGKVIKPSAVVLDRGDAPHPQRPWIPSAFEQTVPVYLYAPATAGGKEAIALARVRIWELLDKYRFTTDNGPVAFVAYVSRVGIFDSEEFPEAVYDTLTYRVTSRIANEV